jgi:hypothetical protein
MKDDPIRAQASFIVDVKIYADGSVFVALEQRDPCRSILVAHAGMELRNAIMSATLGALNLELVKLGGVDQ